MLVYGPLDLIATTLPPKTATAPVGAQGGLLTNWSTWTIRVQSSSGSWSVPPFATLTFPCHTNETLTITGTDNASSLSVVGTPYVEVAFTPSSVPLAVTPIAPQVPNPLTVSVSRGNVVVTPASGSTFDVNVSNSQLTVVPASGSTFDVNITNASLTVSGSVSIGNTPTVQIAANQVVQVENTSGGSLTVAGTVNVGNAVLTIQPASGTTFDVNITNASLTVSGNVSIGNTPTVQIAAGQVIQVENTSGGSLTVAGSVNATIQNATIDTQSFVQNQKVNASPFLTGGPVQFTLASGSSSFTLTIPLLSTNMVNVNGQGWEIHRAGVQWVSTSGNSYKLTNVATQFTFSDGRTLAGYGATELTGPDNAGWYNAGWSPSAVGNQLVLTLETSSGSALSANDTVDVYWFADAQEEAIDQDPTGYGPIYITSRPVLIGKALTGSIAANTSLLGGSYTVPGTGDDYGVFTGNGYVVLHLLLGGSGAAPTTLNVVQNGASGLALNGLTLEPGYWYDILTPVTAGDSIEWTFNTATAVAYGAAWYVPTL